MIREFEAVVENNVIIIPPEYYGKIEGVVRVVFDEEQKGTVSEYVLADKEVVMETAKRLIDKYRSAFTELAK